MAERRTYGSYNDGCAAAHALDLIGDRWAMVVVRELLLGPKRFVDLQNDVMGIGPTVLTRRLIDLVERGVVQSRRSSTSRRSEMYELTPWGYRLEDVNTALARWAVESPTLPWDADMSPDTLILTMRAHARPCPELDEPVAVGLTLSDARRHPHPDPVSYVAVLSADGSSLTKTDIPQSTIATLTTDTRTLKTAVLGHVDLTRHPDAAISGDPTAIDTLLAATRLEDPGPGSSLHGPG